jgi:perosamine synthetase
MIPVYKPYLPPDSLKYAHDALDSTWISSQGKYLPLVTERLQDLLHTPYVIPLNNGTSACHLMAKTLYKAHPPENNTKRKIIVPNNVYVAAWNAFLFDQKYHLIPIDASLHTWNIDLDQLDAALKDYPDADVLIVHNIGNVINVPALKLKYPTTYFVEDNCEGFLGGYGGLATGRAGFASAISFFGNKNITSGEGGAFVTDSQEAYEYAKILQGQGQSSTRFIHQELGYNYRMTNIQAAILYGQLDYLQQILAMKRDIFNTYRNAFKDRDEVRIQINEDNTANSNWMFGIRVIGQNAYSDAESFFAARGIEIRPMFYSIYNHSHLAENPNVDGGTVCTVADLLNKECFILPSFPELTSEEQTYIINAANEYINGVFSP